MKKIKLLALLLVSVLSVNLMADTAEFSYSDLNGQGTSGSGSTFTGASKGNITMTGKGYGNTSYTQIYANGTLIFTPSNGATITKIELTGSSNTYIRTWKEGSNELSISGSKATWTGSSTSAVTLTNTASSQARITNMVVTYTAGSSGDDEGDYVINYDNTVTGGTNGTYTSETKTINEVSFSWTAWCPNTSGDGIQAKKSTDPSLKNTSAFPRPIKTIIVNQTGTARAITMKGGESSSSLSTVTAPATAAKMVFDFSKTKDTYFSLGTPGNACYFSSIIIILQEASANPFTVTFKNSDGTTISATKEDEAGSGVTPPTMSTPCGDYVFAGWSITNCMSETTTAPILETITDGKYYPTKDITLYPIYKKTEGTPFSGYSKVTSTLDDWSGQYLLSTGTYTATGGTTSGNKQLLRDEYSKFTTEATSREFTLTKVGDASYSLKLGSNYFGWDTGTNLKATTNIPTASDDKYLWTPSVNGIANVNTSTRILGDNGSTDFRPYSSPSSGIVYLYKKTGGSSTTYYYSNPSCKSLTGIAVKTKPTKVDYVTGDYFNPAGLVITATYDDVSTEDIAYKDNESKFAFSPNLTTGLTNQTSVTISYEGKTCTQAISVSAKPALSSISLSGTYQTNFIENEDFNSKGLVVTAHYGEAITEDVTSQAEIVSNAYDKSKKGKYTITVNFTDGILQSTTYDVNVWELSASSNNTALGTIKSRSQYVITAEPKEGATYDNPAYTITKGFADVVQGTGANINKFTVSNVTADTKVTINFVEKVKDTYIDEIHSQLTTGNIFYESYNAPNINYSHTTTGDNCQDEHIYFAGWTSTQSQTGSSTAPADMFAAGTAKTAGGNTYYAVWAAGEVTTFNPNDISGTPAVSGENLTWQSTATGVKLKLSAGQLYTSGSPKTFTVNNGTSNYFQISHVSKTIDNLEVTISGTNYKINSVTKGTLTTSGTTHYVKGINATSVQCKSTSSYQIRATQIKVTCLSDYLTACCTPLSAPASITITEQTPNSLSFSWAEVANASGYEYKLSTATEWTTADGTSAKIEGLAAGTKYTIQVRATDDTGDYCENGAVAEATDVMTYYNTEIYIGTPPKKTVYVEGDLFDKEEMVVWYTHEDKKESVSNKVTWSPSGALTTDVTAITVSYKVSEDLTLTTTQQITVKAQWTMLYYINGAEYKRYCAQGDAAEVPEVPAVDGFTFVGWVKTAMTAESETEPSYALAKNATSYTPKTNNDKLYSVYKREEQSVRYGDALSTVYSNTTYFVGGYHANDYFYTESSIDNATVFFFDEPGQIYAYDNNVKKYISLGASNATTAFTTTKASSDMVIGDGSTEGTIVIYRSSDANSRVFALNANANPKRFASYTTSQQQSSSEFTKTSKSVVTGVPYYNTKAEVPAVHHIEVKTEPKKEYFEGDKFDATGLVVWAYYSADDQIGKEVPASQYTMKIGENTDLSNYQLQPSDENVTITFRNASVNQPITVKAFALTAIGITTVPNQDKYFVGADFNPEGMVVMAYFNDERQNKTIAQATEQAPDGYTIIGGSNLQLGTDKVTISYTYREVTKTTDQAITVNSALNEIRVGHNPTKMTYIEGEFFDKTGMVVEGRYGESADWKEVTGWTYEPTTVLKDKGTLSAAEQVKVTISYTESGTTKTIEDFYVTVNPYPKYTVTFNVNGKTDVVTPVTETTPEGGIIIPANPAAIGDYTFAGWVTENFDGETTDKPTMVAQTAGQKYNLTENKTFYAVYTQEKEGDLQGYTYTMDIDGKGTEKTIGYFSNKELCPTDDSHSVLTLYFVNGCLFYMSGNEANYVYFTDLSKADLTKSTYINQAKNYLWTEVKNDDNTYSYYRTNGTSTRYLAWNTSYWRAYADNYAHKFTKTASGSPIKYVLPHYTTSPETAKTPVVKFNTSTASTPVLTDAADHTSLATYFNNTLSSENTTGTVVYTLADGDDAVATIAANGTVTAKKAGSVTVTATVGAVAGEWKEASASYTLTFTKIAPTIAFDDNQPTEVYVGNVVTVHATSNSDAEVKYSATSEKISVNATTGEVTGVGTTTSTVKVTATVDATDLYTKTSTTTDIKVKSNAKTQTLTFAKPEGYDFAPNATVEPFTNTLSGAKTTVTYSLKDGSTDGLVTLNATTGEVSVNTNMSGSAIVVATAEAGNVPEEGIIWAYGEATAEYAINVSYFRPVLTLTPGLDTQQELWRCTQTVTMTAQEGDKIYYTINGGDPTTSNTLYENPFEVNDQMVNTDLQVIIKAIAVSSDGAMTSPVLVKTLTKAVPTMTAKAKDVDVTSDSEIKIDANDVVTLKATACKIDYRILNHEDTEIEKKVGNATTEIAFSKGGTFTLEATPRWSNTNGFKGETQSWTVTVKGAGHLPINYNGNNTGLAELSYFSKDGSFGNYSATDYEKTQIKMEGGTLTVSFLEEPTTLSYHLMLNGTADNGNSVVVQQSADGHSWTTIVTHCTANGNLLTTNPSKQEGARDPYQFTPQSTTRYIRWTYTKKSGNIGLGSIYIGTSTLIVDDTRTLDPDFSGNVIVENGGKLTVDDMCTIGDLTIEPGGKVNAFEGTIHINNLYIQSADDKSGQFLVDNDYIEMDGNAYFDLTLNAQGMKWYDIAVPFEVDRLVGLSLPNGNAIPENDVIIYNGATRAANGGNGSAWEYKDDGNLEPGVGYYIMFADDVETVRFKMNKGAQLNNENETIEVKEFPSDNVLDANWNMIANNCLRYANLGFMEEANSLVIAQVYEPETDGYTPYEQDEVTYTVAAPFFVQVATYDLVDWSFAPIRDILRAPKAEATSVERFTVELSANGEMNDRIYVSASEDAQDSYQIGKDVAKMGVSSTIAQMWIDNYNTKLCANEGILANNTASFPLVITIPADGEYTIAITKGPENAELYLTQDGQPIWNLSKGAYVGNFTKGTHTEYGLMLQVTDAKTPTNLNSLNGNNKATKIFKDYNIYILRDAQMYNTQGVKVQ